MLCYWSDSVFNVTIPMQEVTRMSIELTPRGWVVMEDGLAVRAATQEEAIAKHQRTKDLVRNLAGQWERANSRQPVTHDHSTVRG